jgi:hypothetical protein
MAAVAAGTAVVAAMAAADTTNVRCIETIHSGAIDTAACCPKR